MTTSIGHRKEVRLVMLPGEVLVFELLTIDGLPTSTLHIKVDQDRL